MLSVFVIPFTAQNQRFCCRLLPMIVNILHVATKQQNIVLPTTNLIAAIVSENGRNVIVIGMNIKCYLAL